MLGKIGAVALLLATLPFLDSATAAASSSSSSSSVVDAVIVDVDGSIGDLMALAALLQQPALTVKLITVNGNTAASLAAAVRNVKNFASMLGFDTIPIAAGAGKSWASRPPGGAHFHSDLSFAGIGSSAAFAMCRTSTVLPISGALPDKDTDYIEPASYGDGYNVKLVDELFGFADALPQSPNPWSPSDDDDAIRALTSMLLSSGRPLTYISLGSLTNLADFLSYVSTTDQKEILKWIAAVHIYGSTLSDDSSSNIGGWATGAAGKYGGGTGSEDAVAMKAIFSPRSEWNLFMDPQAADFVMTFPDLTRFIYPLDLTNSVRFDTLAWKRFTAGALQSLPPNAADDDSVSAQPSAMDNFRLWLATTLEAFRTAQEARVDSTDFFKTFYPAELFVALAVVDSDVRGTLDPEPHSYLVSVKDTGTATFNTVSSSLSTSVLRTSFVYELAPQSTSKFWNRVNRLFGF